MTSNWLRHGEKLKSWFCLIWSAPFNFLLTSCTLNSYTECSNLLVQECLKPYSSGNSKASHAQLDDVIVSIDSLRSRTNLQPKWQFFSTISLTLAMFSVIKNVDGQPYLSRFSPSAEITYITCRLGFLIMILRTEFRSKHKL